MAIRLSIPVYGLLLLLDGGLFKEWTTQSLAIETTTAIWIIMILEMVEF